MPHNEPTIWQLFYGAIATLLGWLAWQWKRMHIKVDRIERDHVTRKDLYQLMKDQREENNEAHNELKDGIRRVHERIDDLIK